MYKYYRTIKLSDTDAAGVVYFAKLLSICHEAYEESLINQGIELQSFYRNSDFAIPITNAEIDFFQPIFAGHRLIIQLMPKSEKDNEYIIKYEILQESSPQTTLAKATTRHVSINPATRKRITIPNIIEKWLISSKKSY